MTLYYISHRLTASVPYMITPTNESINDQFSSAVQFGSVQFSYVALYAP